MTHIKNYEYVKKWREANPDLQRVRNVLYVSKCQRWKTIKLSFMKMDKYDPTLFFWTPYSFRDFFQLVSYGY